MKLAPQTPQISAATATVWQFGMLLDTTLATQTFPWRKNPVLHWTQVVVEVDPL
jgi:hypothetical protein